jgi:hypothetical protein
MRYQAKEETSLFSEFVTLPNRNKIYSKFREITFQIIGRGYPRYSAYGVMHIV